MAAQFEQGHIGLVDLMESPVAQVAQLEQSTEWLAIVADSIAGSEYSQNQNKQAEQDLVKEQFAGKPGFEAHLQAMLEPRVVTAAAMWIGLVE